MSSSRPGYHQDYIARIRYTNALPPPPFAPKLLEIATSGLKSGQYTSASFASRLAREQPLNIEADAELGMKIDLVGLPGVFDGDEKAIMFPDRPPPIDPRDRALLRPLASLGKSSAAVSNVSFLRRTEYMTAHKSNNPHSKLSDALRPIQPKKQLIRPKTSNSDPAAMLRTIEKSFNLAYPKDAYTGPDTMEHIRGAEITRAERDAWENPRHPTKSDLTLLDAYPVIPDIAALGDTGSYFLIKYHVNPSATSDYYDTRLDYAVFLPSNTEEEIKQYNADLEKHQQNPEKFKKPELKTAYTAYIPAAEADIIVPRLKRKYDVYDADNDEPDLYTDGLEAEDDDEDPNPYFRFKKLRAYETYKQSGDAEDEDPNTKWNQTVALALHDTNRDIDNDAVRNGAAPPRQKAAYVYPINQRHFIRPKVKESKTTGFGFMSQAAQQQQEEELVDESADVLDLRIADPSEEELMAMEEHRARLDSSLQAAD